MSDLSNVRVIAKFRLMERTEHYDGTRSMRFLPVQSKGAPENKRFNAATPGGELKIGGLHAEGAGRFGAPGTCHYLLFVPRGVPLPEGDLVEAALHVVVSKVELAWRGRTVAFQVEHASPNDGNADHVALWKSWPSLDCWMQIDNAAAAAHFDTTGLPWRMVIVRAEESEDAGVDFTSGAK